MKTTVGPLPAAVYWRRRAVVLGVLFVVAIMMWSACSSSPPARRSSADSTSLAGSAKPDRTTSSSPTVQIPIIGTVAPTTAAASTPPTQPAASGSGTTPTCADTDLLLKAVPEMATAMAGVYIKFTLDVKNVSGHFEHTVLPRTPGRDFSGVVADGPADWIGADVWGTGGDIGFTRDGTHAEFIKIPLAAL